MIVSMCLVIHSKGIYAVSQQLHTFTASLRYQDELVVSTKVAQTVRKVVSQTEDLKTLLKVG